MQKFPSLLYPRKEKEGKEEKEGERRKRERNKNNLLRESTRST